MSWLIPLPLPTAAFCRRCSAGADAAAAPACANAAAALCQQARRVLPQARCRRRRRADRRQAAATCIAEVAPPKAGFAGVRSEAEFMAVLEAGVAAKLIPAPLLPGFVDFYGNYKSAGPGGEAVGSGCGGRHIGGQLVPGASRHVLQPPACAVPASACSPRAQTAGTVVVLST